jgi:tetratricopeptide (TPR) repeat protein
MPDLHLMLAEIAEMENDEVEKSNQLRKFKKLAERPGYKKMFHKYLAVLAAEEFNDAEEAINIARAEIAERPCPQSYDLLAWGYFHQEKFNEALEIASRRVENQTFEPESLFHLGMIYQANGNEEKARYYFTQALKSGFELGPSISKRIKTVIKNLS